MGRIITTGCKAFDFGILLPQYIMFDGCPIPLDSSITFIRNMLSNGKKLEVKPLRIIEKHNSKFAFITLNIKGANEFKKEFNKLQEGELYKVTIDSENETYYSVNVDNTMFRGYIEKTNLNEIEYNIGNSVSARLYKKGGTPLDYLVFTPNVADINICRGYNPLENPMWNKELSEKLLEGIDFISQDAKSRQGLLYKYGKMVDDLIHREILIGKLLLLREIIVKCCSKLRSAAVEYSRAIQHPLLLCDVIIPNASGMRIDSGEQLPVDGDIFIRCKTKGTFRKKRGYPCGNLIGLLSTI